MVSPGQRAVSCLWPVYTKSRTPSGAADAPFSYDTARTLVEVPTGVIGVGAYPHDPGAPPAHCRVYSEAVSTCSIAHASDGRRLQALSECGPQMLELPEFLVRSMRAVARELAAKLPSGSLTEREQLLFLGCPDADLSAFAGADRPTSGTVRCLPPMAAGPRRFLDLSCIHPMVSQAVWALESTEASQTRDPMDVAVRRRVQRDMLCRGYAEGLRAILSRYVPALHQLGRDRPHLTAAWLLLRTQAPFSARVAFARIDTRSNAADTLSAARRQRW